MDLKFTIDGEVVEITNAENEIDDNEGMFLETDLLLCKMLLGGARCKGLTKTERI